MPQLRYKIFRTDQQIIQELRQTLHHSTVENAEQAQEIQKLQVWTQLHILSRQENLKTLYEQIRAYEKDKESSNSEESHKAPNSKEQAYLDTIREHIETTQAQSHQIKELQKQIEEREK